MDNNGYFRYVSADDNSKFIGFRKNGRPFRNHRSQDQACYKILKRNSTSSSVVKMPALCTHRLYSNHNKYNNSSNKTVNNGNMYSTTNVSDRSNKKRRKPGKKIKQYMEINSQTESSFLGFSNFNLQKTIHINRTDQDYNAISNKFNNHNKNQRNLVSKNTENNNHDVYIKQPRHKLRHSKHKNSKQNSKANIEDISKSKSLETEKRLLV